MTYDDIATKSATISTNEVPAAEALPLFLPFVPGDALLASTMAAAQKMQDSQLFFIVGLLLGTLVAVPEAIELSLSGNLIEIGRSRKSRTHLPPA